MGLEDDEEDISVSHEDAAAAAYGAITVRVSEAEAGSRLDQALAALVPPQFGFSRSRLRRLIENGCAANAERTLREPSAKVKLGEEITVRPPPPAPIAPQPEPIPLSVAYEDAHLIVVDKPAGMAAHPAPGSERGTLVNALLAHCGDSLSGVGGAIRPGIVHRIDKDTSGLLVVAKTDAAHQGLAAQFAAHDLDRVYLALVCGAPDRGDPRLMGLPSTSVDGDAFKIDAPIARSLSDRKKMAVARSEAAAGAKRAVTRFWTKTRFGLAGRAVISQIECRLETGRTHQIRVHLAHVGHPILGDPLYGRGRSLASDAVPKAAAAAIACLGRQALHAARLGFVHPVTGAPLSFDSAPPDDISRLITELAPAAS